MRNLTNIIFYRILKTSMYTTVALSFCAWIVQSSRYLILLNTHNIPLARFLEFTSYLSVDIVSIILPIALGISSAFVYHRFKISNQLIALQSAGISPIKLLMPLLNLAYIVVALLYIANFYISPICWKSFRNLEFEIKNNIEPPQHSGVIFSGWNFSVYAKKYIGKFDFGEIYIVDSREPGKVYSYFAQKGSIKDQKLLLLRGERVEFDVANKRNSVMGFQSYSCDLHKILRAQKRTLNPNEQTISELWKNSNGNNDKSVAIKSMLHQKITSPILALIFSLMSFLAIIYAPYTRKPKHTRIGILVSSIIFTQGVYFWIANSSAKSSNLVFLFYAFILLLFAIIMVLLKNARSEQ